VDAVESDKEPQQRGSMRKKKQGKSVPVQGECLRRIS
jgi:hypothetical protein